MNSLNTCKIFNSTQQQLLTPTSYYRQHEHDIKKPEIPKTALDQCKRVGLVALPFIGLYQPFSKPLSMFSDGMRSITSLTALLAGLQTNSRTKIAGDLLNITIAITSLAGTIIVHPLGMLISTGHDLALNTTHLIHALSKEDYKQAAELCGQIVTSSLHLSLFFTGAIEISILATSLQVLMGTYQSWQEYQQTQYLESIGHGLMTVLRVHQLHIQVQKLHLRAQITKSIVSVSHSPEGAKDIADILMKYDHDPKSSLLRATWAGDLDSVKKLLNWGIVPTLEKGNLLDQALFSNNPQLVEYLEKERLMKPSPIAFELAISRKNFRIFDELIKKGYRCHETLLQEYIQVRPVSPNVAPTLPEVDTIDFLMRYNDVMHWKVAVGEENMRTLFDYIYNHKFSNAAEILKRLVQWHVPLNIRGMFYETTCTTPRHKRPMCYNTPLMAAIGNNDYNLTALLLQNGANVNFIGSPKDLSIVRLDGKTYDANTISSYTPLQLALDLKNSRIIELLLMHGAT